MVWFSDDWFLFFRFKWKINIFFFCICHCDGLFIQSKTNILINEIDKCPVINRKSSLNEEEKKKKRRKMTQQIQKLIRWKTFCSHIRSLNIFQVWVPCVLCMVYWMNAGRIGQWFIKMLQSWFFKKFIQDTSRSCSGNCNTVALAQWQCGV